LIGKGQSRFLIVGTARGLDLSVDAVYEACGVADAGVVREGAGGRCDAFLYGRLLRVGQLGLLGGLVDGELDLITYSTGREICETLPRVERSMPLDQTLTFGNELLYGKTSCGYVRCCCQSGNNRKGIDEMHFGND